MKSSPVPGRGAASGLRPDGPRASRSSGQSLDLHAARRPDPFAERLGIDIGPPRLERPVLRGTRGPTMARPSAHMRRSRRSPSRGRAGHRVRRSSRPSSRCLLSRYLLRTAWPCWPAPGQSRPGHRPREPRRPRPRTRDAPAMVAGVIVWTIPECPPTSPEEFVSVLRTTGNLSWHARRQTPSFDATSLVPRY
jgi:hypothetical protein